REGPICTVILDRPEARNAVDREHADALAEAFRAFEADDSALAAVLWGAGGSFCAGADLKRMDSRIEADADGPMGPSRLEPAEALAREIASFPQPTMRADRASVFEGLGLPVGEAMRREFERGVAVLGEARRGADRFAAGEGRHGTFRGG